MDVILLQYFLDENDNDMAVYLARNLTIFALLNHKRFIPRINNYAENIVPLFDAALFRSHFRVTPAVYDIILREVQGSIVSKHGGGTEQIEPSKQLLIFLAYMASQESLREISVQFGVGIKTVHDVVKSMSYAINTLLIRIIDWPSIQTQQAISRDFQLQSGIPGIIGALDGTHIRLYSAPKGDRDYFNRKQFPSIQLQVVCDSDMVIRHAYTGWPGCTHDARVLRNSSLFEDGEQGNAIGQRNFIIADSAYPLRNWLITPFRNTGHLTPRQHRFNRRLSSARQIVERCYGHLKGRFRRLREITVRKPPHIIAIIISGCILHNLCVLSHDDVEDFIDEDHDVNANFYPNIYLDGGCGAARRNEIMNALL